MQSPREGGGSFTPGTVPHRTAGDGTAPPGDKELNDLLDFSAVSCLKHNIQSCGLAIIGCLI